MTNPTRELVGTVVDANGVAATVYRDMAMTELLLEFVGPDGAVALTFTGGSHATAELARMLMGQRPRGLRVL